MNIAIIGAGFSGAVLYDRLKKSNHNMKIFDKSRGSGGRCSTRYINDKKIDHGTPYFKGVSENFKSFCDQYVDRGILRALDDYYYPNNGINKICSSLIDDNDFYRDTKITKIYKKNEKWALKDQNNKSYENYDFLFITIPAPQILELDLDLPTYLEYIFSTVEYESVATLIVYSYRDIEFDLNSFYDLDFFRKIVDNSKKYKYDDFKSYLLHCNAKISQNITNKQEVQDIILNKFNQMDQKLKLDDNFHLVPHLWKYGFVSKSLDEDFLFEDDLSIGFCGDYFGEDNLQSAYDSALKLFEHFKYNLKV